MSRSGLGQEDHIVQEAQAVCVGYRISVSPVVIVAVLLPLMTFGVGCGEGDAFSTRGDRSLNEVAQLDLDQPDPADSPEIADPSAAIETTPSALAAQLEQDMAALRDLQNRVGSNAGAGTAGAEVAKPRRDAPVPLWNDPKARATSETMEPRSSVQPEPDASTSSSGGADEPAVTVDGGTAQPATIDRDMRLGEALVSLRRELYAKAVYADSPLRDYLGIAAMTIVDPDRALDPDALVDLTDREREMLRSYQDYFIRMGRELAAQSDESKQLELIDDLKRSISNRGPLQVARAEFCTRVEGFGRFVTFSKNSFLADAAQEVILYTEIEEFSSTQDEAGKWVTNLWQELEIYSSRDNIPVWRQSWQSAIDKSNTRLSDFYITHRFSIPQRLSVGSYVLKVRVRDEATGSIAEEGVPFQVVADPSLAAVVQ